MNFASVAREYEKNKDLKKEDVQALREWAKKQPHLPEVTELEFILFLHSCYYKLEATKACIDTFYTVRAHCPEFFANRNPLTNSAEILDLFLYTSLPQPTPEGYTVIFCKMLDFDPDRYTFASQVKAYDTAAMLMLHLRGTSPGYVVVTDMKGVTFAHLTKLVILHLRKFFFYLQDAMPVRIKGLHFINIPSFMDKLISLIKPFIKKELMSVLHLHTDNLETLDNYVPRECLSKDYGGKANSIADLLEAHVKEILDNAKYFIEEEKRVVDESKRPGGKAKNDSDVFGLDGSFRQLTID